MRLVFIAHLLHLHFYLVAANIEPKISTPRHTRIHHADAAPSFDSGGSGDAGRADVWSDLNAIDIAKKAQARMKEKSFTAAASAAAQAAAAAAAAVPGSPLKSDPSMQSSRSANGREAGSPNTAASTQISKTGKPRVRRKYYLGEIEDDDEDEDPRCADREFDARREVDKPSFVWRIFGALSNLAGWLWIITQYAATPFQLCGQYSWALFLAVAQASYWSLLHILRPVRIGLAPAMYVFQGFAYLFIILPSQVLAVIAREIYPIYVYFGAAAFVGTSLGLGAAGVLWAGSYVFVDPSKDSSTNLQVENVAGSSARKSRRRESVVERSIRENRENEARARKRGQHFRVLDGKLRALENIHLEDSSSMDDEPGLDGDDYAFRNGTAVSTSSNSDDEPTEAYYRTDTKGKGTSKVKGPRRQDGGSAYSSSRISPPTSTSHLPVGATGRGGWQPHRSAASGIGGSPLVSPSASLTNSPVMWRTELSPRNAPETLNSYRSPSHLSATLSPDISRGPGSSLSSYVSAAGSKRRSGVLS